MKEALAVAPDEIASSFTNLGNTIKTDFQRVFGAMLKSIQPGIDRLRASLESPGGQRFLLGLQKIAETAGKAVGWLAEQVGRLVDWIGNNWNAIMPTAVALAGLFAGKLLLAGAAAVAANLPLFAMIGIIVENPEAVASLNAVLHDYGAYVIGRMGIPYHKRGVNLISIAIDAPQDVISALSGKIGRLPGVSAKTAYSGKVFTEEAMQ
jgi:putative iron-only hydrogenase system regulator